MAIYPSVPPVKSKHHRANDVKSEQLQLLLHVGHLTPAGPVAAVLLSQGLDAGQLLVDLFSCEGRLEKLPDLTHSNIQPNEILKLTSCGKFEYRFRLREAILMSIKP
jgi:hypothetical protein